MFTGIVTATGTIQQTTQRGDLHAVIACPFDPAGIAIGASIACSGVCLTVVEKGGQAGDAWFAVDISGESVACTVPGLWQEGRKLNLEPALKIGDELGGHIVTGHVDAVGEVVSIASEGDSTRLTIAAPPEMAPYIAPKGSITVDGVSLTVNSIEDQADRSVHFGLNIIPHTSEVTTLGQLARGDRVNLEIDVLARYLKRMESLRN
ncbi:riboflavin synthase [Tsuneonella sp. CC-YZS046]|uniref:riboflavin synthase n=1 Tax=Tsuneonella sp. CC-YZS046 TaxID=3042152 RepID=UPI002D779C40|nr:riboflavin synthase [Tsuneonella sp. CC-YZS046]WRO66849.1 riboflavin synthase [Tsuneonella sp. CC-YZS046]